jgi:uncharacterized protein (UPF0264 family)
MNLRIEVVNLHVHLELSERATQKLDQILAQGVAMSAELDALTASVAKIKSADDSIIALVKGLADQLRANANDPAAINALAAELDAESAAVADAVAANTPAAPPTV